MVVIDRTGLTFKLDFLGLQLVTGSFCDSCVVYLLGRTSSMLRKFTAEPVFFLSWVGPVP